MKTNPSKYPLLIVLGVVLSGVALAAAGISLSPTQRLEFVNCSDGGNAAQTLPAGSWVMRVTDADTRVCLLGSVDAGAACDGGTGTAAFNNGDVYPQGTVMQIVTGRAQSVSCRSFMSTGDLSFQQGR